MLIHNINLIGHRKSAYCPRLLVFMKICIIVPLWHLSSQVFSKGCCHHDLNTFCETGCNNVLLNNIENMKLRWVVYHLSLLLYILWKDLEEQKVKSKTENRLWASFLVCAAASYQTLLGQTQTKPYWSKFS